MKDDWEPHSVITQLETVAVYVGDQDRARDFYVEQLGFEVRKDQSVAGGAIRWIEVAPPGAQTVLAIVTPPGMEDRIGRTSGLVFLCDDVRATTADLQARGVEFTREPIEIPSGWWAEFTDPDGNRLGLSQLG